MATLRHAPDEETVTMFQKSDQGKRCVGRNWIYKLFFVFLAIVSSSAMSTGTTPVAGHSPILDPCVLFSSDQERVNFFVNMQLEKKKVSISVPKIFLEDGWDHISNESHNSQLFRVTLDTFEPVSRAQASTQNRNGIHDRMTFVIGDTIDREDLATIVLCRADSGVRDKVFQIYDLEPSADGLQRAVLVGNNPQRIIFFALSENVAPDTIVSCWIAQKVPFSRCDDYFRSSGMDVKVKYRTENLGNWQTIQDSITRFLSCAIDPSNIEDI